MFIILCIYITHSYIHTFVHTYMYALRFLRLSPARLRAPPEVVADWLRSPDGAAAGACWFWVQRGLKAPADAWEIDAVTRAVNGPAMLGRAQRRASAEAALAVLQKEA